MILRVAGLRPRFHLKFFEYRGDMKFYGVKGNFEAASDFLLEAICHGS